jgi:heat shock protein HslJ
MKLLLGLPLTVLAAACMTYPPPPPITPGPPGGTYRGHGHAPNWSIAIDERNIRFGVEGRDAIFQPTPRVIVGIAGEIYQTPRIGVNIVHQPCSDPTSNSSFPDRLQVTVDGQSFNGCGGDALTPNQLAGTRWRVVAVNGRSTPAAGEYWLNFEASRFGAKLGCNGLGADYRQTGNTIYPGPVIGTRMACPDMSFETQGGAVLGQTMTVRDKGPDSVTLTSSAGTIALKRSY